MGTTGPHLPPGNCAGVGSGRTPHPRGTPTSPYVTPGPSPWNATRGPSRHLLPLGSHQSRPGRESRPHKGKTRSRGGVRARGRQGPALPLPVIKGSLGSLEPAPLGRRGRPGGGTSAGWPSSSGCPRTGLGSFDACQGAGGGLPLPRLLSTGSWAGLPPSSTPPSAQKSTGLPRSQTLPGLPPEDRQPPSNCVRRPRKPHPAFEAQPAAFQQCAPFTRTSRPRHPRAKRGGGGTAPTAPRQGTGKAAAGGHSGPGTVGSYRGDFAGARRPRSAAGWKG